MLRSGNRKVRGNGLGAGLSSMLVSVFNAVRRAGLAAAAPLAVLLAAAAITYEAFSLRDVSVAARDMQWIKASSDLRPRRPFADEVVRDMRWPPTGGAAYQVSYLFMADDVPDGPVGVLAGAANGTVHIHVNGVRVSEGRLDGAPYLVLGGMRPVYVPVSAGYFHPYRNRIDITVSGERLRPVMAFLAFGEAETILQAYERREAWRRLIAPAMIWMAAAAAALCFMASFVTRRWSWFFFAGSAAAATGLGAWLVSGGAQALPGVLGPAASLGLMSAAFFMTGFALARQVPLSGGNRVIAGSGVLALTFGVAALANVWGFPDAAWWLGMAAAVCATMPLGLSIAAILRDATTGATAPVTAATAALMTSGVGTWFLARSGLAPGGGLLGAEWVFQACVILLLALAAAAGGRCVGAALWTHIRNQLDSTRIIERQREQIDRVSQALRQAIEERAVLEERQRLVRDMHDGIGGQLMSIYTRVRARKVSLKQLEKDLGAGLQDLRLIVDSLDSVGSSLNLALSAFEARARQQTDAAGVALRWQQAEEESAAVRDPQAILSIYRWMQEALTNAIRHSGARRIEIAAVVSKLGEELIVSIADDGVGMDTATETPSMTGKGLVNMRRRAADLSGRFEILPGLDGRGVKVVLAVPLRRIAQGGASVASTLHRADP